MLDEDLLPVVCCPETRQKLKLADLAFVEGLNADVARGKIRYISGKVATEAFEGGLLREDGTVFYPIIGGIPVLIYHEGVLVHAQK
ncbi:MAG: hypothetical protein SFY92_12655 [Verrucomicrobiae bacterium]|nr:hypothetical protein [Verrucomicrobiae bacterium]